MSKPRYWWWPSVKAAIRHYPALRQQKDELLAMQITRAPDGGGGSRGNGINRTVERIAMRELEPAEELALNAVSMALETTELQKDGRDHVKLIRLYYWGGMTLLQAADRCYIDERTAKRWHGNFVRQVARGMGFLSRPQGKGGGK